MSKDLNSAGYYVQRIVLFFSGLFVAMLSIAQDKKVDVNINVSKHNNFWSQPWVWVVGAAVFILLLVAILRSGNRRDA